jgi:ribosomal protein L7/L12
MSVDMLVVIVIAVVAALIVMSIRRGRKRRGASMMGSTMEPYSSTASSSNAASNNAFQTQIDAAIATALQSVSLQTATASTSAALGIARVVSDGSPFAGSRELALELDAIGAPKRHVTAPAPVDQTLAVGDRVYVLLDSADPSTVTIAPASMTGGQTLPREGNRLDALVLGPQILTQGERAKGVVKSVEALPMANPALAARGFSKWRLDLEVSPERGWPYRAELTTSLSTPEKAARIAQVGAELPLRYDPEDPSTLAIDSIEMGYGNPYEALRINAPVIEQHVSVSINGVAQHAVVLIDAGHDKIRLIKAVRDVRPGMSLADAKNFVERVPNMLGPFASDDEAQRVKAALEAAGATVVSASSASAASSAAASRDDPSDPRNCAVVLTHAGDHLVNVVRALVRIRPDLGLKPLKQMADDAQRGLSVTVQRDLSRAEAQRHVDALGQAGASARIE